MAQGKSHSQHGLERAGFGRRAYEEPHAGTQGRCGEPVERPRRVNVDWMIRGHVY